MSERIEYARKVVTISLYHMGKHPLYNVNKLNRDDKKRLITTVMDIMRFDNTQIEYAFNCLTMSHVIYPTHKYCYTDYKFDNYDDDLTIYLLKE
jgi:hypothetical protein